MNKIFALLLGAVLSTTITFAQEGQDNRQIASNEALEMSTENRFIEGISLGMPAVKHKTNSANSDAYRKKLTKKSTTTPPVIQPEFVDEPEPAPDFKNKSTISRSLVETRRNSPKLYSFIQDWYGTPYRLGGTSKRAIDCSAFTRQLFSDVYAKGLDRTAAMQYMMTSRIYSKDELKEGDLVFFSIKTKRISHVGVYLGEGRFVHASSSRGVMVSNLSESYWTRYYAGAGRL
ncbi:MAG TPA: C40 family peptidase [Edaphocola sp.]|nr:C40 family peptidase [Edaphocola sp.]